MKITPSAYNRLLATMLPILKTKLIQEGEVLHMHLEARVDMISFTN